MIALTLNQKDLLTKDAHPLLLVPYMDKSGIDFCQDPIMPRIDLSRNAHIKALGLLFIIQALIRNVGTG